MQTTILRLVCVFLWSVAVQSTLAQETKQRFQLLYQNNLPIAGADIKNITNNSTATANFYGEFEIEVQIGDRIEIRGADIHSVIPITTLTPNSEVSLRVRNRLVAKLIVAPGTVRLTQEQYKTDGVSYKNYWVGATVAYNLEGLEADNFVGAATIELNPFDEENKYFDLSIIGNLGSFIAKQSVEDRNKDAEKIVQSKQGLNIGIGGIFHIFPDLPKGKSDWRLYGTIGYRFNSFQDIGPDSVNIGFSQQRNVFGFEFESPEFKNGGKLTFSSEVTLSFFDKHKYKQLFNDNRSSIQGAQVSLILPMNAKFGILFSSLFSQTLKPVYQFGIVLKDRGNNSE